MYDPYAAIHAGEGGGGDSRSPHSQFWGEWTGEDARRVEAGGEGRLWGECWQWPVVESVSDRILRRYQDGWALHSLYRYPPPPPPGTSTQVESWNRSQQQSQQPTVTPQLNLQQTQALVSSQHLLPSYQQQQGPTSPSLLRIFSPQLTTPWCGFCKGNGECAEVYSSHQLRSPGGSVCCPYLRGHTCEICGDTGDKAHTRSYCPQNPVPGARALPTLLKGTLRQSDGRYRRHRSKGRK